MKIAVFTDTYFPQLNGVPISIDNFARVLRRKGHKVYIYAPKIEGFKDNDEDVSRLSSVKIISSEPEVRVPIPLPNKIYRQMLRKDFDLVHAHGNGAFSMLGYQVAKLKNVPFILTFHNFLTKYTHYVLNGRLVKPKMVEVGLRVFGNLCEGVITPSEKMKEELARYGVKGEIKVIPSFIDSDRFLEVQKGYLHKKFKIPQGSPILLSVGRLGKEKKFDFLIQTFKELSTQNDEAHLVIVGYGPQKTNLVRLVERLGLTKRVHFTSRLDKEIIPKAYADADIFVFASDSETQGICVLEAATSGLPFVVVDDLAFDNLVKEGVNGYRSPLKKEVFARKIAELLGNEQKRKEFGLASSKIAAENFQDEKLTNELVSYYDKILTKHKAKRRILRRIADKKAFVYFLKASGKINKFLGFS